MGDGTSQRNEDEDGTNDRIEEGVIENTEEENRSKTCDMSPKEDLNLPVSAQNDSDSEPIEEPSVVPAEAADNEAVPGAESNTVEKANTVAVSPPEPIMEKHEEILDVKDEDSEEASLQESIVIGTVQISDTVQIDQEVYNETKEKEEGESSILEEVKEAVIETTAKIADGIAKILDEPEGGEKESKGEESVTELDGDVENEPVISSVKFAHDLSENRRSSTFLTEVDENDENDKIVEEKVEEIVEKVVAEHSSGPSETEEVTKEEEAVVEKLLEEFQTTSESQLGQTEEISSQTETIHETSSTSQTEAAEEISSMSQTETVEETSSTSQTETVEETSSTSQTEPEEIIEVLEKTSQTVCSIEPHTEKVEIIEEPIIEILQTETEALEENDNEKVEELARSICSNMEEPPAQMETTEEVPIGALAIAVLAIFLALIIFYR